MKLPLPLLLQGEGAMFPLVPGSGSHLQRERSEPTAEVSQGRIVGYDSNRVIEHTTYDKNGILSHEGTGAADRPCQGDCLRQSRRSVFPNNLIAPDKGLWPKYCVTLS